MPMNTPTLVLTILGIILVIGLQVVADRARDRATDENFRTRDREDVDEDEAMDSGR